MSASLIDQNLSMPIGSGKLSDLLERDGNTVKIRYSYNSGGDQNHLYFVTADGGVLGIDTVIAEIGEVDFTDPYDRQWHLIGYDVNYENHDLVDDHTGAKIAAAYEAD